MSDAALLDLDAIALRGGIDFDIQVRLSGYILGGQPISREDAAALDQSGLELSEDKELMIAELRRLYAAMNGPSSDVQSGGSDGSR